MNAKVAQIIDRARNGALITAEEIGELFSVPPLSEEAFLIQAAARQLNEEANGGVAEIHGQVGVNTSPCPCNCEFCSFAAKNGVFSEPRTEELDTILAKVKSLEQQGANAIYLMATADLPFSAYLKIVSEVRRHLAAEMPLIANIGDFGDQEALALKESGVAGIYHAVRLGEGEVTGLSVKRRLATMQAATRAGLKLGTCLEPVGPEHSLTELVEKTLITRDAHPVFSGSARRIPIPGTSLSRRGMVSEARMALLVAVVRVAVGAKVPGNCTHEPNVLGAVAGANLIWAEAGANPRDTRKDTEAGRGFDVVRCREIFREAETPALEGPSRMFGGC